MKKFTLFSLLCLMVQLAVGQTDWQTLSLSDLDVVLNEIAEAYHSKSYRFETRHQSYKGHDAQQPYDEMTGFFAKSGQKYHANMLGAEVFQDSRHKVVIQHQHQVLQLHLADEEPVQDFANLTGQFPGLYESIAYRHRGEIREYRITYKEGSRVGWMTFRMTPQGFLEEMVLYLSESVTWEDESGTAHHTRPKVRIAFENLETDFRADASEFDPSPYVVIHKKGVAAGDRTTDYELKDLRLPQK